MTRQLMAIFICVVVFAGIVAGCGSSDDGTTGGGATTDASISTSGSEAGGGDADQTEAGQTEADATDAEGNESDDGGDEQAAALTKDEFVKQANAVCAEAKATMNAYFAKEIGNKIPSQAQVKVFAEDVVVPALREEAEALRALGLPSGDEKELEAMLDAFEAGVEKAEKNPSGIVSGSLDPFNESKAIADKYGLQGCAQL